ncbi:MAG: ribosomal RNA small subunit methyltransferase A [candidate division Zixibacteria bacterium]|nr:ribosomal RNA small subunit methyltransferase A [candidate division Zixibacteria bacterium]
MPRPRKRFGQHFLSDRRTVDRIVAIIAPSAESTIVEIGPGEGVLTLPLAKTGARLVAVEFDRDLIRPLEKKLLPSPNARVIQQDFLDFEPEPDLGRFVLAGNIPYNITSPVIDWCVAHVGRLARVVLMVQREMGKRIAGRPGTKDWSPLSIMTQLHFDVHYEFEVPPSAFTPPPDVHSAVIRLVPRSDAPVVDHARLDRLVRASFTHRRKLLVNNLVPEVCPTAEQLARHLVTIGARPDCRAEQISIDQFILLTGLLTRDGNL